MLVTLRRRYAELVTSGGQAILLTVVIARPSPEAVLASLALMLTLSLAAWTSATRRARAIGDTPTARVASAAQGYTELRGRGKALGGLPLLSPLNGLPCLWYRFRVERRDDDKWVPDAQGESDTSFILDDGTGQCLIDPEGAEMLVTRKDSWSDRDRRYTQWSLIAEDPIYALGHFRTRGSADLELDVGEDVRTLLADWKKDHPHLLKRFDLDRDGEIDLREWELARRQARREVEREHREARAHAEAHVMHRPEDGRLYLISDLEPPRLARRYRLWSAFHLLFFFGALGGLAWAWQNPF